MDVDLLYVVNIVRQRGPIACHRLACLGALSHSLTHTHTHTNQPYIHLVQNATKAGVRRGMESKLFIGNIIEEVHSHLIVTPTVRPRSHRNMDKITTNLIH